MQPTVERVTAMAPEKAEPSSAYKWYVVAVLTLCYTLSFVDRTILGILFGPIKRDLGISDQQVGLLSGLAFAIFYTFLGLPVGRWADQHNRRNLISAGVAVWSFFTAAGAMARSFFTLFLARIGVGVGESALSPSAYSMLADLFPRHQLSTAISLFYMGAFLGGALANFVGGATLQAVAATPTVTVPILGTIASWRLTFLIVGIPGLIVALLMFTIKEPVRKHLASARTSDFSIGDAFAEIGKRWKSVTGISLGLICHGITSYGFLTWSTQFFIRVHGWSPARAGYNVGFVLLVGALGMYCGGRLSDYWVKKGEFTGPLRVVFPGALMGLLSFPYGFMQSDPTITLICSAVGLFFWAWPMGTSFAAVQLIFPNQARALVSAIVLFVLNMGGNTIGPWFPGYLNDKVFHDEKAVGQSLGLMIAGAAICMFTVFALTLRSYRKDYIDMHGDAKG